MNKNVRLSILLLLFSSMNLSAQEITPLFDYWKYYADDSNALYRHLTGIALEKLEARKSEIAQLRTKEDWLYRQDEVRDKLNKIIGGFPEKTPLNARITGKISGDGFTVEKVIYESIPGYFITAALFIPDQLQGKAPGVLYCSGHTFESFRSPVYQHMIINLVKKGCVVLAFDPIGQGERLQYLDDSGLKSIFRTPTHEHSYPGGQCFIAGNSLARYMIWDGIRSIDYLLSRPEVDPGRLGITGRSGGGTQSAYIAAYDPRIKVTAPECYITSFEYLFKSIGPQDAEQNFPGFLAEGLDLADLLEVRAPGPALIISTTRDFFSIQGARDTYHEVKKEYEILGSPGLVDMTEDDAEHETTLKNRQKLYAFFKKHLGFPGDTTDLEVKIIGPDSLRVTSTGQVIPELNGETVFSLNEKESRTRVERLEEERQGGRLSVKILRNRIIRCSGYTTPVNDLTPVFSGREIHEDYRLEKYLVPGGGNYYLPTLVLIPRRAMVQKAVVIFNPSGKESEMKEDSLALWLAKKGYYVILPDVAGFGELGPGYLKGDAYMEHTSYNQWFAGILTGKSPLGLRMADIKQVSDFIRETISIQSGDIFAIARGVLAPDLLHACHLIDDFERIALINPLVSYGSMVFHRRYHPKYIQSAVPASLGEYDLPDLASMLAPKRLLMVDICDQNGQAIKDADTGKDIQIIREAYDRLNKVQAFQTKKSMNRSFEEIFGSWLN
jgi:dienelactone hydrolase